MLATAAMESTQCVMFLELGLFQEHAGAVDLESLLLSLLPQCHHPDDRAG